MSRYRSSGSCNHSVKRMGRDWYRMGWTVDFYYPDSRLRFPRRFNRDTDFAGAMRFAIKWDLPMPQEIEG